MRSLLLLAILTGLHQVLAEPSASTPTVEIDRPPSYRQSKQLWAQSFLYAKAPDLVVQKWLSDEPDTEGKFVLLEFWATWCSACRRAQPRINRIHEQFGEEIVVIGVSDEPAEKVLTYIDQHNVSYHMAIDPQARMKDQLGVWGIPHVIIIEPGGYVIWEGFPLLEGYELSEVTIQRILDIGRIQQADEATR